MPSVDSLVPKPAMHIDAAVMQECEGVVDVPHRFVPSDEQARGCMLRIAAGWAIASVSTTLRA